MMYVSGARNTMLQTKGSIQEDGMKEENEMALTDENGGGMV